MPVSWRGTIAQYVGRLHRLHEHKQDVRVHDYADLDVPMLARMFDKRCRGYEVVGYSISVPASAAPGWPSGIALPADGSWKHRYGASLRRLLRDGVDEPLADLFTQVAREIPAGAQGAERARSASEAFPVSTLARPARDARSISCERTAADPVLRGWPDGGRLSRPGIEAGCWSWTARNTWPTVKRTGATAERMPCCRNNGYLVLRFLAEDLGTRLDAVLDGVLRAFARRTGRRMAGSAS